MKCDIGFVRFEHLGLSENVDPGPWDWLRWNFRNITPAAVLASIRKSSPAVTVLRNGAERSGALFNLRSSGYRPCEATTS